MLITQVAIISMIFGVVLGAVIAGLILTRIYGNAIRGPKKGKQ